MQGKIDVWIDFCGKGWTMAIIDPRAMLTEEHAEILNQVAFPAMINARFNDLWRCHEKAPAHGSLAGKVRESNCYLTP